MAEAGSAATPAATRRKAAGSKAAAGAKAGSAKADPSADLPAVTGRAATVDTVVGPDLAAAADAGAAPGLSAEAEPTGAVVAPDGAAVVAPVSSGPPVKPTKAERAAARSAAAEPAVAGLVMPKLTRPAVPDPESGGTHPMRLPLTGRWWTFTACAVGLLVFFASIITGVLTSTHTRAHVAVAPSRPVVPAASAAAFISVGTGTTAGLLVLANGQVLYYNDQDGAPPSSIPACVDACSTVWRPLAPSDSGPLTTSPDVQGSIYTIVRPKDGTTQVTFNGHPLYEFTIDGPGHVTGNGLVDSFNGQAFSWHAASATDTPVIPSPSPSPVLGGTPTPTGSPSVSPS